MNLQDPADYQRRKMASEKKPEIAKPAPKPEAEPDGDEQANTLHITVTKSPEGGYKSTVDAGDGFPPDEMTHESLSEAHKQHGETLSAKFGEPTEGETEEAVPESKPEAAPAKKHGGFREMFGGE